jgi:hypothetical protein
MELAGLIKKPIKFFIARPYYVFRNWWPIWRLYNWQGILLFHRSPLKLTKVQARIVADLKRDGIAQAHIDELFPGRDLLPLLQKYKEAHMKDAETSVRKSFYIELWDSGKTLLTLKNPFVRLALSSELLGVVNSYMGLYTKLHDIRVIGTHVVSAGTEPKQSQRWHRDPIDKKMCKCFIYLSDVDEGAGPFIYIPGSQYGGRHANIFPYKPPFDPRGNYAPPGEVEKSDAIKEEKHFIGPAGTVLFIDTIGLHRGGYSTVSSRWSFVSAYRSPASFAHRWKNRYPENFGEELAQMSKPARFAVKKQRFYFR